MGRSESVAGKLVQLKECLGWYFGGVSPVDWNPYMNIRHFEFLLRNVLDMKGGRDYLEEKLAGNSPVSSIVMFIDRIPELVDYCGEFLGAWK